MKIGSNKEQEIQPMMILTIDIGNGHVDKLQLFDLNNIEQETYDFCVKNKLDFNTMQEINTQIQNVLKDKQIEEEQEMENEFQEIKEEEDEKITENNMNEAKEQESIIVTNSNEIETQKGKKIDINKEEENKKENNNKLENDNINFINNNNPYVKKNINQSIRTNNSTLSNGNEKKVKKLNKPKKKNIKDNIKEAIAMAKEKTKKNIIVPQDENGHKVYSNIFKNVEKNSKNIKEDNDFNTYENKNIKTEEENSNNIIKCKENDDKVNSNNNDENAINGSKTNLVNNLEKKENNSSNKKNNINNENGTEKNNENEMNILNNQINNNIINIKNEINVNDNEIKETENNNNSKENKKRNKSISYNGSHISGYNPGKGLYERGIKFMENEKEKLEALKKNLEVDEEEDNTFTPKINKLSDFQREKIRERRPECTNPEIINNYRQYKNEKMEILKKKTEEEFNKIYTFKPCINRSYSSTKIINNKLNEEKNVDNQITMKNESRFDKLYNYRIGYKENKDKLKEKIYNEYSFKPQINENSSFYKLKIPFNERLKTYSNKSKENMNKIQKVYERELGYNEPFKPHLNTKVNKNLLKDREEFFSNEAQKYNANIENGNNNNIDHYTKLYLYGQKYQQEKNFLTEKYYQNQIKTPKFCESTEDIINKKKEKSFKQIFKILDGDEDSKISSTHINISKLPKNIVKILQPIFNELKEENETLNELEFIFVCEQLYLSLPWNEKRELTTFEDLAKKNLKKEKIIKEKNNFSFKPKINKRNYSFETPTILNSNIDNREINNNNLFNNDIYKNKNNCLNSYKNFNNYNNYYSKKSTNNNSNEKIIENKIKTSKNQVNNRVIYFNAKASNQNSGGDITKKNNNEDNIRNKNKYSILKNVNINIIGKNSNNNEKKSNNNEKNSKIFEKKINYNNFVNVKISS